MVALAPTALTLVLPPRFATMGADLEDVAAGVAFSLAPLDSTTRKVILPCSSFIVEPSVPTSSETRVRRDENARYQVLETSQSSFTAIE